MLFGICDANKGHILAASSVLPLRYLSTFLRRGTLPTGSHYVVSTR